MEKTASNTYFQIYRTGHRKDDTEQTRWRFLYLGNIIATGGEPFVRYEARYSVERIQNNFKDGGGYVFEIEESKNGKYYWTLNSKNGRIVAISSDFYKTKTACQENAKIFKKNAVIAPVRMKRLNACD